MKKIVFVDSGIGGLFILKQCTKLISGCNFYYVADTFNAPYGNKNKSALKKIALELIVELHKKYNADLYVLACNTLTVNTIKYLREKTGLKIVGTEPPLKKAKLYGGDTVYFATKSTIKRFKTTNAKITSQLKQECKNDGLKYVSGGKTYKIYIDNLPQLIEENLEKIVTLKPLLMQHLDRSPLNECDNLVLGCTHFTAIKPLLEEIFPDMMIWDSTNAVASRVQTLIGSKKSARANKVKIITTDGDKQREKIFQAYFESLS